METVTDNAGSIFEREGERDKPVIQIEEARSQRRTYGGGEEGTRYSQRTYREGERVFRLDKDLEAVPRDYRLTFQHPLSDGYRGEPVSAVRCYPQHRWGEGLTWKQAEGLAKQAITDLLRQNPTLKTEGLT